MSRNHNEPCSLCNVCDSAQDSFDSKLISIADARLYNIRYGLNREVDYELFRILILYKHILHHICNDENCNLCYGLDIESILERIKILTVK